MHADRLGRNGGLGAVDRRDDTVGRERNGLCDRLVEPDQLIPAALEMAQQIAANSPYAVRWAKKVVNAATTLEKGRETEIEAGRTLRGTDDNSTRFRAAAERVTGR